MQLHREAWPGSQGVMDDPDPLVEEIVEAIDEDGRVLMHLCEDLRRLIELTRETGRRHHEVYMAWLALLGEDSERTPPSGGFVPRFVKK